MKKLSFITKFIFLINIITAFGLLFTYIIPYINPEKYPEIAILSLTYPILLIINIVFVVFWMIKLKIQFILSSICIVTGFIHINSFFSLERKEIIKQNDIKILSFNVRQFNASKHIKSPNIKQDICDFVNKKHPDILFVQEHLNTKKIDFNLPKIFHHKESKLAIYSKYPVVNKPNSIFKLYGNNIIYADLVINQEIIRVYNVHLESFKLKTEKEYFGNTDNKALVNRFEYVFKKQAQQIKKLKENIKNCKYRTIVVGDFNNTAFSWNYHEIMENRKDAFVEAGINFGKSYKYFFPFRIDFILPDNTMEVGKFTTFNVNLSDHYPIMARIDLKN